MSFLNALFGRSRPAPSKTEGLFAISTAQITLQVSLHLQPANQAAICFKSVGSARFGEVRDTLAALLQVRAADSSSEVRGFEDGYGFQWFIGTTTTFEDTVTAAHMVAEELRAQGFGEQLLAAVFRFVEQPSSAAGGAARPVYWLYNFKRGRYYPFVPRPGASQDGQGARDTALELRLRSMMEKELPIEQELDRWYAL
ncbi:MAG: hypothetical protein NVSMB65_06610 [Chloroflexota bacterium]